MIANFHQLASTPLRKQALLISEAGLAATSIEPILKSSVGYDAKRDYLFANRQKFSLKPYQHIMTVGIGPGSLGGVDHLQSVLGNRMTAGFVIDNQTAQLPRVVSRLAFPGMSVANTGITKELMALLRDCSSDDLIITVVTGGDFLSAPAGMMLEDKRAILNAVLESGATPDELEVVRKHLSSARGGHLAKLAYPAAMINLIFAESDLMTDLAGGPTVKDSSTVHDAQTVLSRHNILEKCGLASCQLWETPKEDRYFEQITNLAIPIGDQAQDAMASKAKDLGFRVKFGQNWGEAARGECWIARGNSAGELAVGDLPSQGVLVMLGSNRSTLVDASALSGARRSGLHDLSAGTWAQDLDHSGINFNSLPLAVYLCQ